MCYTEYYHLNVGRHGCIVMNIYVDFDDCLCETARHFSGLVAELFGKDIPYENIKYFNLQKSFSLTDEQYEIMMIKAHSPEVLLSYEETPGAVDTVNGWIDSGYDVSVITGRPYSAYAASRKWLDEHGLFRARLYCLNKYGRDSFIKNSAGNPGRGGHVLLMRAAEMIYECRKKAALFFGAGDASRVCFTGGCTEALNAAIFGCIKRNDLVITSNIEHNSVRRPLIAAGAEALFFDAFADKDTI